MLPPSPSTILDHKDAGDDVIARFRYQFCNVAINALRLVSDPEWAKSVICENFEDLILERHDGRFVGIQVKTRARQLPTFKLTDSAVEKSLVRFVQLKKKFPDQFVEFQFVTNHEMWVEKDDERNLPWLISATQETPSIKHLRKNNPKKIAIERLCCASNSSTEDVIGTLIVSKCTSRREDVKTIVLSVQHALLECDQCSELQHKTVLQITEDIIHEASLASTRGNRTWVPRLYAADANFSDLFSDVALLGKKIDRLRIQQLIADRLMPTDEPLTIEGLVNSSDLPKGLSRMFQKMAAGGVETSRINHTQDLVRSFESLKIKWTLKYGRDKAHEMINDLLARTLTECVEAEVAASRDGKIYGSNQFAILKEKLDNRYVRERDTLHGCKSDHLLGAAGVLTEDCKVWWSEPFVLMDEGS